MSRPDKGKPKTRDRPPSLFLHPSPAASHASLPGMMGSGREPPSSVLAAATVASPLDASQRQQQQQQQQQKQQQPQPQQQPPPGYRGLRQPKAVAPLGLNRPAAELLRRGESSRATDRTDALWAEMQATLEEVELSASGGTRVFGPDHDRKLGELRAAQVALAQAWARSEAADEAEARSFGGDIGDVRNLKAAGVETAGGDVSGKTEGGGGPDGGAARSTAGTGSARPPSSGGGGPERLGARLEEETEADILLARKRREANDRYFQRVNRGVLDVVAKLEEVAVAMRAVEQESKDIWADDQQSIPGSAKS